MRKNLKQLILVIGLFLSFFPVAVLAQTPIPGVNGYNTVPNPNEKIIPKQQNPSYVPPNVEDSRREEVVRKKKAVDKKKKSEKAVASDEKYDSVRAASDRVSQTLKKENPSVKEMEEAEKDIQSVKKYIEKNKDNETADQIQSLKNVALDYENKFVALEEQAKEAEEAKAVLQRAKTTTNPTEMSKLTSYIYLEEGFFGLSDVFPKVVNAIVQGFFFLTKVIYCLVIIVLEQVFNANAYEQLDSIVSFSAQMFRTFMSEYQYAVYALALMGGVLEFLKTRRFPFRIFRFLVVWFLALFLYQPASFQTSFGNQNVKAEYNLSQIVKIVDGAASDVTRMAIAGFDSLEPQYQSVGSSSSPDGLKSVKESIFEELVYKPFVALNFTSEEVPEEKLQQLFTTNGKSNDVKKFSESNESISQLSWNSIGAKFLTALASLIKAIVVGFSLIVIGLISIVFKYLALIMLVFLVVLFFIAMLPGFEPVLGNAGKKIVQFVFLGGLGLFGVRAFLFVNSLIESAAGGMTKVYFWVAILQGLVWFVIWLCRSMIVDLLVQGTLSAQEVGRKVQGNLSQLHKPGVISNVNPFSPTRFLNRGNTGVSELPTSGWNGGAEVESPASPNVSASGHVLVRAAKRGLVRAGQQMVDTYDTLRYGEEDSLERQEAIERRMDFKQRLLDAAGDFQHVATIPKLENFRSKLHDLAGDTDAPVQEAFKERRQRHLERKDRQEQRRERRFFRKADREEDLIFDESLVEPQEPGVGHKPVILKGEEALDLKSVESFEDDKTQEVSPFIENLKISEELFEKGAK